MTANQPLIYPSQYGDGISQLVELYLNSVESFLNIQLHTASQCL
jgi:hypothetical protein